MKHGLFSDGLILLAVCSTVCCTQNKNEETPTQPQSIAELRQQLEKILAATHTPGLSVAIAHRDGVEWVAGLGQSDVATNHATTDETLFRVGSVSKSFASLSILKLINERKLSLHDTVRTLAPEIWFENRWEATHPVREVPPSSGPRHATAATDGSARPVSLVGNPWTRRQRSVRAPRPDGLVVRPVPGHLVFWRSIRGQRRCLMAGAEAGDTPVCPLAFDCRDLRAARCRGLPRLLGRDRHPDLGLTSTPRHQMLRVVKSASNSVGMPSIKDQVAENAQSF